MTKDPRRNQLRERVAPGFWIDMAGGLHVSIPELLDANGLPDTPENRATATEVAREFFGHFPIIERDSPEE